MSLTFYPKNMAKKILGPERALSNIVTVKSARAIDRGFPLTCFLTPSSEKKMLTKIYPIRTSVSWTTLKSILLDYESFTYYLTLSTYERIFFFIVGIIAFKLSWLKEWRMMPLIPVHLSSSARNMPASYESLECLYRLNFLNFLGLRLNSLISLG